MHLKNFFPLKTIFRFENIFFFEPKKKKNINFMRYDLTLKSFSHLQIEILIYTVK